MSLPLLPHTANSESDVRQPLQPLLCPSSPPTLGFFDVGTERSGTRSIVN
jgi:hypothetical protein